MVGHGDALQLQAELQREQNDLKHEVQALLEERDHLSCQLATGIAPGIFGGRFVPSQDDQTIELNKLHLLRLEQHKVAAQIQQGREDLRVLRDEMSCLSESLARMRQEEQQLKHGARCTRHDQVSDTGEAFVVDTKFSPQQASQEQRVDVDIGDQTCFACGRAISGRVGTESPMDMGDSDISDVLNRDVFLTPPSPPDGGESSHGLAQEIRSASRQAASQRRR